MIYEFETAEPHGSTNADGSERPHCCGCWHVRISDHAPLNPQVRCNECGEVREFKLPGGIDDFAKLEGDDVG